MNPGPPLVAGVVLLALAAAAVIEWCARRPGSVVPTFAHRCRLVLSWRVGRWPVGRILLLGFWWWVGWHFFAR